MNGFHTVSLADQVFEKLENDIIQGVYPKDSIITELKLVEQLGVSRTPIREALRRLEQEHLIEDTGKGSLVLGISVDNLIDIMDIRLHLEPIASYYAAKNITPDGIQELAHILDLQDFYLSKHDIERLRQGDDDFHDVICQLSRRAVISDTLKPLHRKTRRYRKISIEDDDRQIRSLEEHHGIYEAIAAGDADLAAELTRKHVEKAKKSMIERVINHG